jgi:hypothetical protein
LINRWKKYIQNLKKLERENLLLRKNLSYIIRNKYPEIISKSNSAIHSSINDFEFNVYSQNGEDGILLHIVSKIGIHSHTIIEFGGSDGIQCNSANLLLNFGWKALLIEGNAEKVNTGIKYYHENGVDEKQLTFIPSFITSENINQLFTKNNYKGEIDILSIDIDGNDYHVWKSIHEVNPRIIVCEYNAAFGPEKEITIPYDSKFTLKSKESTGFYFGCSLALLEKLGKEKGYSLIGTDKLGVNAFFVRNDLMQNKFAIKTSEECYHENLKCKQAGGYSLAFDKIKHLDFFLP